MLREKGRGCILAGHWSRELDGRYPGQHSKSDLSDVLFVGLSVKMNSFTSARRVGAHSGLIH